MYKLIKNPFGVSGSVRNLITGVSIPFDPANTDYQAFLAWLAEGNEPEPADTQGEQ